MTANCCKCDVSIDPDDECPYCLLCLLEVLAYLDALDEFYQGDHELRWAEL